MKKIATAITIFLGISMFMFGILKFIDPFKTWYTTQIIQSELPFPFISYWSGQLSEIAVGLALILTLFPSIFKSRNQIRALFFVGNILIIPMMLTAIYVHMHPGVPESVLPLKIRPPFIPGLFMLLACINIYLGQRTLKNSS